jgi:hypothetical protein
MTTFHISKIITLIGCFSYYKEFTYVTYNLNKKDRCQVLLQNTKGNYFYSFLLLFLVAQSRTQGIS